MVERPTLVYGTCVALGRVAAVLQGISGSGKSDLALRFARAFPPTDGARLVADDQVYVTEQDGRLMARAPELLAGKIEVRGIGIVEIPYQVEAELRLIVRLCAPEEVPRMPPAKLPEAEVAGQALPVILLAPFEASAPLKLRLALTHFVR